MDVLDSLLDGPRGRGAVLTRTVMSPPWSVLVDDEAPLGLAAVVSGGSWMVRDGSAPVRLPTDSIALVKGPAPVTFASDPSEAPQVVCGPDCRLSLPGGTELGDRLALGPRSWGNDPSGDTQLLLGCYQLRGEVSQRVLQALPDEVVLTPEQWRSPLVGLLAEELTAVSAGQQAVLERLFDLLLVTAIRQWFNTSAGDVPGWYRAHQDPVVGPALQLLHERPELPWSVATLAGRAGTSRSVLARSFTETVGVPPMTYLRDWRLARAADLLLDPDLTVDVVARRVGYSDGSSFSRVFRSARGRSPQDYRNAVAAAD